MPGTEAWILARPCCRYKIWFNLVTKLTIERSLLRIDTLFNVNVFFKELVAIIVISNCLLCSVV